MLLPSAPPASVAIRPVQDGDAEGIIALFAAAGYAHDLRFWHWFNRANPDGPTIARVAVSDGAIVGHYAVLPRCLRIRGRATASGLAVHAVIHPTARNLTTLINLCRTVYDDCGAAGLAFVYGFPNDRIWPVKTRLLGWIANDSVPWMTAPIDALAGDEPPATPLHAFHAGHARLLDGEGRAGVMGARSADYLNWRFIRHPEVEYQAWATEDLGGVSGWVVAKIYDPRGVRRGHIVDMAMGPTRADVGGRLLAAAHAWFVTRGVQDVWAWAGPPSPLHAVLVARGFARGADAPSSFGVLPLSSDLDAAVTRTDAWALTMTDSDAF